MKYLRWILLIVILAINVLASDVDAQSKPKYSSSPKPSSKPPTTSPSKEKPKFSSPGATKPKPTESKDKPKYSPPIVSPVTSSKKPTSSDTSAKARAMKESRSERKFVESQKAVAPPKSSYTTPDGKEVKIATSTKAVEHIRNQPSANVTSEVRQKNVTVFIEHHHYSHPYSWYVGQPTIYVGGGYSSAFWWMMMNEWESERRAQWLYNNRYSIESDAYNRGVQDAKVATEINRLENQRKYRDPNYIDKDFVKDPSLMYDGDYVRAAYNPAVVQTQPTDPGAAIMVLCIFGCIILFGVMCWGVYYFVVKVRWGN